MGIMAGIRLLTVELMKKGLAALLGANKTGELERVVASIPSEEETSVRMETGERFGIEDASGRMEVVG